MLTSAVDYGPCDEDQGSAEHREGEQQANVDNLPHMTEIKRKKLESDTRRKHDKPSVTLQEGRRTSLPALVTPLSPMKPFQCRRIEIQAN